MGKDRYSDDHTIEVVGGTNTVNITNNLSVGGDLAVGGDIEITANVTSDNLEVTTDLTVGNDVSVGNDLTVDGNTTLSGTLTVDGPTEVSDSLTISGGNSITSSGYNYTSDISVQRGVSIFELFQSVAVTGSSVAGSLETPTGDYVALEVGSPMTVDWYFYFPIDNYLLNNGELTSVNFLLENKTNSGETTYDFEVSLLSFNDGDLSLPSIPITVDNDIIPFVPAAGRQWYSASLSATISSKPLGTGDSYYLKFKKVGPGTGTCTIYIYRCVLKMNVSSVSMGLNKV